MRTCMILAALLVGPQLFAAGPQRHFTDAPLRAVQFIDRNEGWAIGDDGVVWHSIDGGTSWDRQNTGVRGSLARSISSIPTRAGSSAARNFPTASAAASFWLRPTAGSNGREFARMCSPVCTR